jgi:hypothetical protein
MISQAKGMHFTIIVCLNEIYNANKVRTDCTEQKNNTSLKGEPLIFKYGIEKRCLRISKCQAEKQSCVKEVMLTNVWLLLPLQGLQYRIKTC